MEVTDIEKKLLHLTARRLVILENTTYLIGTLILNVQNFNFISLYFEEKGVYGRAFLKQVLDGRANYIKCASLPGKVSII